MIVYNACAESFARWCRPCRPPLRHNFLPHPPAPVPCTRSVVHVAPLRSRLALVAAMNVPGVPTTTTMALHTSPLNAGLLIAEVHARRPLWDKRHELHNQRELIEALWNEVAGVIGVPVPRIRVKWKNLKDSFRREAKRAFTEINYRPRWRLYQPLMFLYDQQMEFDVKEEDRNSLHSTYLEPDQTQCEYDSINNENASRTSGPCRSDCYGPEGYMYPGRSDLHSEDADMCFFRSLLPHMKELSPQKRMQLRIKIHEMVYKEVYSDTNEEGNKK